jgi:outer membrane protein OmpA-like peptidoglycan-associated protein
MNKKGKKMNKMVKIVSSVMCMLIGFQVYAQTEGPLAKADLSFSTGHYKEALVFYGTVTDQSLPVLEKTALSYYFINDYANAEKAFAKIIDQKVDVETVRYYAEVLLNNGKHKEAAAMFKKYKDAGGKTDIAHREKIPTWAAENAKVRPEYGVQALNIETGGRSLGLSLYKDGIIFATPQELNVNDRTIFYDLAYAAKKDSVTFDAPQVLTEKDLNSLFYEGSPSVGGEWMYFTKNASEKEEVNIKRKTQNKISKEGVNVLQIYVAQNVNGVWSNIKALPVNSIEYSCTHPSISSDGKTLYFVSNMPGGFGGYDIYKMERNNVVVGGFGKPENMGKNINSAGNEMFPHENKGTLYFTSNGFTGFGGYDIYSTDLTGKIPGMVNMGIGMNSAKDDFAAVFNADGETGYLSSNRDDEHGYDKIYSFKKIWYPFTVNGVVKDKITLKAIPAANVKSVASNGKEINTLTDSKGNLSLEFYPNLSYNITFSKEGYVPKTVFIPAFTDPEDILALLDISLEVEAKKDVVMNLDNIYFAFGKAEPLPESLPILDRLIEFMNDHPEVKIELSAHTDCRGSDAANIDLSSKRAKACYDYLVSKKVNPNRMVQVGLGESKLLNQCKDGVECSEDLHQKNRRVEIKIL